jgi:hypothetical protein
MFSMARKNFAVRLSRAALSRRISVFLLSAASAGTAFGQEPTSSRAGVSTPLSELLAEGEKTNLPCWP